uniref:Glycosyltransferase n=1 Tax=Ananas comosus var. bracteatus TaxID=296719 RepID=A0A6V7QF68_ANACO|nr:unnamed protein product [Ananas comosus var. bracteatus]
MAVAHVLVLPYPSQGHINPMLEFAKRLAAKGPAVTVVVTRHILASIGEPATPWAPSASPPSPTATTAAASPPPPASRPTSPPSAMSARARSPISSTTALSRASSTTPTRRGPSPWRGGAACPPWRSPRSRARAGGGRRRDCGGGGGGDGAVGIAGDGEIGVPVLRAEGRVVPDPRRIRAEPVCGSGEEDWVLFNSFDELEGKVLTRLNRHFRARAIGPCVPLAPTEAGGTYGVNLLAAEEDTCMKWLDAKPPASVVYVAFGSFASLPPEQTAQLAQALLSCNHHFLWVVRASEEETLPPQFAERLKEDGGSEKGLVVKWSPQVRVLAHGAVGCFVTHCGWNSTLEAIGFGVPTVAMGLWTDQPTNAKHMESAWGVGVRAAAERGDRRGRIVRAEEIERCVREVMEGEEIRRNARRWRASAERAAGRGGSSDVSLDEFVGFLSAMKGGRQGGGGTRE